MFSHRYIFLIFAVFLYVGTACLCSGSNSVKTVAHYRVSSRGFTIGNVTTTQRMSDDGNVASVSFETKTAVKASFLWMGFQQDTLETGTIQKQELVRYSRKGRENSTTTEIEGRLENAAFRFDVREQGSTKSIVIPRNSYDYTTMECPEAQLDFTDKPRIALRILDVEKMAVVTREYRLIRNGHYSVSGKEHPCRIVEYSDLNKKARRWISYDGTAVVMYRQDGKGEGSPYSVQAVSVVKEM
jgi:hypothetical protein